MSWQEDGMHKVLHIYSLPHPPKIRSREKPTSARAGRQPADIAPKESGNEWKKDGGRRKVISDDWKHLAKMQVSQPNNVKIYNLSAGKSLPEVWTKDYRYIFCIFGKNRFTALLGHNTCGYSHGQIANYLKENFKLVNFVLFCSGFLNERDELCKRMISVSSVW